jgi:UDP-N-acetylmuramate dehydrogenase
MARLKDFARIVTENVPLSRLTSIRVGGPARFLYEPRTENELAGLVAALESEKVLSRIIGGGTNILASDGGFDGAVIRMAGEFARIEFDGTRAVAGAAGQLSRLVRECAERGLAGAEGLVGIPGSIGGALVMNAGGRWGEIGQIVESVRILGRDGSAKELPASAITFEYRHSSLRGQVVLSAAFRLCESDPKTVKAAGEGFLAEKRAAQDLGAASAGCVFKNPPGDVSAGALIDRAGLKGAKLGGAQISQVHANFIVNAGGATAKDVLGLAELAKSRVREAFGVDLEYEVELW